MELRQFLSALARGWIIVLVALLLGLLAAGLHARTVTPSFQSSARLYVGVNSASNLSDLSQANSVAQQLAANYAQLAVTPYVLKTAAKANGVDQSASTLAGSVTATVDGTTAFINLSATAPTARSAQRIAEAVSTSLITTTKGLTPKKSKAGATLQLIEVQPASLPGFAMTGGLLSELPLGAVAGLIIGVAIVLLRTRLSSGFTSQSRVAIVADADVIGTLPDDRRAKRLKAAALQKGSPVRYEAFRSLRIALHGSGMLVESGVVLMVTSSVEHEGKTSTVGGLAVTIAASGREVVVLEADLYRPRVASFFDVAAGPGLAEVLDGDDLSLDDALQQTGIKRLRVLRAGTRTQESSELLESPKLKAVLNELRSTGAVVLIDTPPLLALSDSAVLAQEADYVLLVVGAPTATERDVRSAVAVLRQVQVGLAGVIVNRLPRSWSDSNARAHESYLPGAVDASR